ncbi:MAG: hypothetical protein HQL69_04350, partial [Magnetococcales bacterium]|nr:hypothetical protein [Magnetococcales bacterium]
IQYGYDIDGLLTNAGLLTITYNSNNGLLTGTTLGSITTTNSYNQFAETQTFTAKHIDATLFQAQYQRDKLGRRTRQYI